MNARHLTEIKTAVETLIREARESPDEDGVLGKLGWVVVAQKGSHAQLKHPARGGRVTVPNARSCDRMKLMRTYTIVVEPDQDGGYFVTVPALPGCFTRGSTIEQCRERAVEAIEVHISGLQADGEPIPEEAGPPQLLAVTVAA